MDDEARSAILDFFMYFARTEYALKAAGWARAGARDGATADWTRVKTQLRVAGRDECRHVFACAGILIDDPPKRQVLVGNVLDWRAAGSSGDQYDDLVEAIKRVRNNLFHGGKFDARLRPRSLLLMRAARDTLEAMLDLPGMYSVRHEFERFREEAW